MKRTSINDNFTNILNFINSATGIVSYEELLQYVIDYDQYKEYYMNYHIFKDILIEHNNSVQEKVNQEIEDSLL